MTRINPSPKQRIDACSLRSTPQGDLDLAALAEKLDTLKGRPVILVLICGTSIKGAHDDIVGAIHLPDAAGYGKDSRYVHVDGLLNAMVLPFLQVAMTVIDRCLMSVSTASRPRGPR